MELDEITSILRTLAAGHDPRDGEELGPESRALMADQRISSALRTDGAGGCGGASVLTGAA